MADRLEFKSLVCSFIDYAINTKNISTAPTDLELERSDDGYRVRVTWGSAPPKPDDYHIEIQSLDVLSDAGAADIERDFKTWQAEPQRVFAENREEVDG
jgi:hypothetical protein